MAQYETGCALFQALNFRGIVLLVLVCSGTWPSASSASDPQITSATGSLNATSVPARHRRALVSNNEAVRLKMPLRRCYLLTTTGVCVQDFLAAVDDAYKSQWPGTMDLFIRTHLMDDFFLTATLLRSVDLMWPRGVGQVVLVLDKRDERAQSLLPGWVKVLYEENHLNISQDLLKQWSYAWADKYTTADFVAIIDDSLVFNMKVTPQLLFNLSSGKPYLIGNYREQKYFMKNYSEFATGEAPVANFMVQLPFIVPRGMFRAFREHVGKLNPSRGGTYDAAFQWWDKFAPEEQNRGWFHIQHNALGNFLAHFHPDKVQTCLEWTDQIPIPRVAVHIPFNHKYTGNRWSRVNAAFIKVASYYSFEAMCFSLPRKYLEGCEEMSEKQEQVWRYAFNWNDWPLIFQRPIENATMVYDCHMAQMACFYEVFSKGQEKSMTQACLQ